MEPKNDTKSKREQCEALLRSLAESGRFPSADELFELRSYGLSDTQELRREVSRLKRRLSLEAQAGTKADRLAMEQQVLRSAALLETEAPKIQAKLDELAKELRRLENDARLSEKRLGEMRQAASMLKEMLPDDIKADFARRRQEMESMLFVPIQQAEARIRELEYLLSEPSDANEKLFWHQAWRRHDESCVDVIVQNKTLSYRLNHQATAEQLSLRNELGMLREQLPEMQAAFEAANRELDEEMEDYCDGK